MPDMQDASTNKQDASTQDAQDANAAGAQGAQDANAAGTQDAQDVNAAGAQGAQDAGAQGAAGSGTRKVIVIDGNSLMRIVVARRCISSEKYGFLSGNCGSIIIV